jgi:fucose 4-O-acetylase-like acetyltransferase
MGLSFTAVQRLMTAVLVATILVAFTTRDAFSTAWTVIALSTLVGFIWAISNKDATFTYLGLNSYGILTVVVFLVVSIIFAEWCMTMWGTESRVGIYGLSLVTVGTFWWTIEMMEPSVTNENQ